MSKARARGKVLCLLILSLFLLSGWVSVVYAAENPLIKEYVFESDSVDFDYKAEQKIKKDGKSYDLKGIQYKVMDENSPYISKEYTYRNLPTKQVPLSKSFTINGKKVQLQAEENDIRYSETLETITETLNGYTVAPKLPRNKVFNIDGTEYEAMLMGVTQSNSSKPFTATVKFIGTKGTTYYLDGKKLILKGNTPSWNGFSQDVIEYLGLEPESTVSAGRWTTGYQQEDGQTVRYAQFNGTRPATNYTATYTYKRYSTTVTYDNGLNPGEKQFTVKAICTYEKEGMSLLQKAICAGVGILLLSGLVVLILYIIARKKRKNYE